MPNENVKNLTIENAHVVFRNFSGKAGKFNAAGNRNFGVLLETPVAEELVKDGWNVKWLKPRDPADSDQAFLPVAIRFDVRPPRVEMITSRNKTKITEETVNILDFAEIIFVDLIIQPYHYDVNGKTGIKAYVKSMYITIAEEEFEGRYVDTPDTANSVPDDDSAY